MVKLTILNYVIPVVLLAVGFWLKRNQHPYPGPGGSATKWKVDLSGYNTPESRKSKARWDYAQQIAPAYFLRNGKAALAAALACTVFGFFVRYEAVLIIGAAVGFGCVIEAFVETEKELKANFGE